MDVFLHAETWVALLTLTFLEIVLGIDNIIFISLLTGKLPAEKQKKTRNTGLLLALVFRILLLSAVSHIIRLTNPLFTIASFQFSARSLILIGGGLFLLGKSTMEIHEKITKFEHSEDAQKNDTHASFITIIIQIILLDIVFSFDSILTAVGLTEHVLIMIIAVILAMIVMIAFSGIISNFINKHPSFQILALSFLILIGTMLIAEAFNYHVPKGYIYFAVAYSLGVELINMKIRSRRKQM
ncbi:MAG: TerC family protein [Bacteroidetes bacterium]|nr:MAG: TerC family protein [Bacteroidota bacterium]